jgi:hypothetical protein
LIELGNLDRLVVYKTTGADANSLRGGIGESMTPDFDDAERAALAELLTETIATDRFPLSPRLIRRNVRASSMIARSTGSALSDTV